MKEPTVFTPFKSLEEAEEFASSLSGKYHKVLVELCDCGCNEAVVYSVPPGNESPVTGQPIIYPGPYRKEFDFSIYKGNNV